jgi:Uma2 family endonuclease
MSDMASRTETSEGLITVEEFDRMWNSGIIKPEDRVELIEGRIVPREPMNAPHMSTMVRMTERLIRALGDVVMISSQLPFIASERSKPFPDFTLVKRRDDYYAAGLPVPSDVVAVVEVSDTSLRFDRGEKLRLYAKVGVPEYWIVDVKKKAIELYRDRHELGYAAPAIAKKADSVAFAAFPDVLFSVDELLG